MKNFIQNLKKNNTRGEKYLLFLTLDVLGILALAAAANVKEIKPKKFSSMASLLKVFHH